LPGLKVVCPAIVEDAGLLLRAAINDPNPPMFFEQKSPYTRLKGGFSYHACSPLAGAAVRRRSTSWGSLVRAQVGASLSAAFPSRVRAPAPTRLQRCLPQFVVWVRGRPVR
jgi:pyruvate/2-oxoglutarate/acetoin dehydrogenase E1 component